MASKKKETAPRAKSSATAPRRRTKPDRPKRDAGYEAALKAFASAVELLHKGDYARARDAFERIAAENAHEMELSARARDYAAACARRLAPEPARPKDPDELYYRGVVQANAGRLDAALELLGQALDKAPGSAKVLYARATTHAQLGDGAAAISDLRAAVGAEPTLRFQALNDPDFDGIRDEAGFIDVVEPTPAGA